MSNRHATYLVACLTDTPQISGVSVLHATDMWRVWQTRHKAFFPFPATKVLSPSKKFLTLSLSLSLSLTTLAGHLPSHLSHLLLNLSLVSSLTPPTPRPPPTPTHRPCPLPTISANAGQLHPRPSRSGHLLHG